MPLDNAFATSLNYLFKKNDVIDFKRKTVISVTVIRACVLTGANAHVFNKVFYFFS